MPAFLATMRVVHVETWEVDAENEIEARMKFANLTEDVVDDDSGGEVVDWEVYSIRRA